MAIGINSKPRGGGGGGGGGISVTTNYLDSFEETLAAGFTTALGNTYNATRRNIDEMWVQYSAAKSNDLSIQLWKIDNTKTDPLTPTQVYQELLELEENYKNARIYNEYIY